MTNESMRVRTGFDCITRTFRDSRAPDELPELKSAEGVRFLTLAMAGPAMRYHLYTDYDLFGLRYPIEPAADRMYIYVGICALGMLSRAETRITGHSGITGIEVVDRSSRSVSVNEIADNPVVIDRFPAFELIEDILVFSAYPGEPVVLYAGDSFAALLRS